MKLKEYYFSYITTTLWFSLTLIVITTSILICDGHLVYSLDDPYIHLAVAENIIRGGYGINLHEFSSPSSSILYPLMLSITELIGLGALGPIVLNLLAALCVVFLTSRFFELYILPLDIKISVVNSVLLVSWGLVIIFITNSIALPMTGMEHIWHVLFVIITLHGIAGLLQNGTRWWFYASIILMPLIRFEGLAFSCALIIIFFFIKPYRMAAISLIVLLTLILIHEFFMKTLGLPILPSSVLMKSEIVTSALGYSDTFLIESVIRNFKYSLSQRAGLIITVTLGLIWISYLYAERKTNRQQYKILVFSVTGAIIGHIFMGQYGWFFRYEVYILTMAIFTLLYLCREMLKKRWVSEKRLAHISILLCLLAVSAPYVYATVITPKACRGIFEQQFQMHRFVADFYQRPVAVNDIGLVSYMNDEYVLDLYGLGSEEVRQLKSAGKFGKSEMSNMISKKKIELVMIYDTWFEEIPDNWRKIAVLKTQKITAASGEVSFYITPYGNTSSAMEALLKFKATIPSRVQIDMCMD
ncbi:MAG: hypothetical protein WBJ50_06470 [Smithellaceae bacterium]|jgi:hypothetical protein